MTDCTDLGKAYMRQGLNVLVLGLLLGMIPVTHYMLGAIAGDVGHHFMKNITSVSYTHLTLPTKA